MKKKPRVITDNDTFFRHYHELAAGDLMVGRLRLRPAEEHLLLDLTARGVLLIPSALSQLASRSKVLQARLFAPFMVPQTLAIYDHHDFSQAINLYNRHRIERVVTKHDRRNAGMGIHLWASVEEVHAQASFGVIPYPFVLQPFCVGCRDIRVVILGDYLEAYFRHNPDNFRHNLHWGGESEPMQPSPAQLELCRQVMARGSFPYGHVDLMVTEAGDSYLAEINLRGGIRGARINQADYLARVEAIHRQEIEGLKIDD